MFNRDYLYFLLFLRNFLGDKFVQRYTLSSFTILGNVRYPKYLPTKKVANTELCGPECNLADRIESQYPAKLSRFATGTDQDFILKGNRVRQNDNFLWQEKYSFIENMSRCGVFQICSDTEHSGTIKPLMSYFYCTTNKAIKEYLQSIHILSPNELSFLYFLDDKLKKNNGCQLKNVQILIAF